MKIVKPLRLGVLHRPWRWAGQNYLGVAVMALADMGRAPRLRPEPELWQLAEQELAASGGLLDLAIPKPCAEFLATGYAYTAHQQEKTACMVKVEVGGLGKSLLISGERFWVNNRPTPPRPFERLRVDWQSAYGGADFPDNPLGLGASPLLRDGELCHPLAHIDLPGQPPSPPGRGGLPACFGPLDFTWPRQFAMLGGKYDRRWLEQDFPGFARDMDWRVFNRAEQDQQWPRLACLPAGAPWRIWNMHPERPLQEGTLPPWQARCFVTRGGAEAALEAIPLRATTVWFFPHLEQLLLIWHGRCALAQDDAADITALLAGMELAQAPRPTAHYQDVLRLRGQKESGAAYALREQDLIEPSLIGPWLDTEPAATPAPLAGNLARREARLRRRHGERAPEVAGADDDQASPLSVACRTDEAPSLMELPDFIARLNRQAQRLQQQANDRAAALGCNDDSDHLHRPTEPADHHRMKTLLDRYRGAASSGAAPMETDGESDPLLALYRLSVDTRLPAPNREGVHSQALRKQVLDRMATSRDLSGLDLTGADLSHLDLRQANCRRALLASANLDGCRLDGADLSESMLAHASLRGASLNGARLDDACLAGARCLDCDFSSASLRATLLSRATFERCRFDCAQLCGLLFEQTALVECRWRQATLENCLFMSLDAQRPDFSGARLIQLSFLEGRLQQALFCQATLDSVSFVGVVLDEADFRRCALENCAFTSGSRAPQANFAAARLLSVNFRQTVLAHSDFSQALAVNCDFSEADLTGVTMSAAQAGGCLFIRAKLRQASLVGANLMGAIMHKCDLAGARLSGANLFRADLAQATLDGDTRLDGAYLIQCNTLPRFESPSL